MKEAMPSGLTRLGCTTGGAETAVNTTSRSGLPMPELIGAATASGAAHRAGHCQRNRDRRRVLRRKANRERAAQLGHLRRLPAEPTATLRRCEQTGQRNVIGMGNAALLIERPRSDLTFGRGARCRDGSPSLIRCLGKARDGMSLSLPSQNRKF